MAMRGDGPIVLRLVNHSFHEHMNLESATREAERLVDRLSAPCVVYVPVIVVTPPQGRTTTRLPLAHDVRELVEDADLPF